MDLEKNLQHQTQAFTVFNNLEIEGPKGVDKQFLNPVLKIYDGNNTYPKTL